MALQKYEEMDKKLNNDERLIELKLKIKWLWFKYYFVY